MLDSTFVVQQAGHYISKALNSRDDALWSNTLAIPLYASCLSFLVLFIRNVVSSVKSRRSVTRFVWASEGRNSSPDADVTQDFSGRVSAHGGALIFTSEILRLAGCVAAAGLSISWFTSSKTSAIGLYCIVLVSLYVSFARVILIQFARSIPASLHFSPYSPENLH